VEQARSLSTVHPVHGDLRIVFYGVFVYRETIRVEARALALQALHVRSGALREQAADVLVASLADARQVVLCACAVLPRYQSDRRGEAAAAAVLLAIADVGGEDAGRDRPRARYRHQTLAKVIILQLAAQLFLDIGDRLVEVAEMALRLEQGLFGVTKRMEGRHAASQMASASMKSFLLLLPKGRTNCGEISLTSWP